MTSEEATTITATKGSERAKQAVNKVLTAATGYQLTKAGGSSRARGSATRPMSSPRRRERLVNDPGFVLSPVRSGSTLLRVILNSHTQICAPPEMHLRAVQVKIRPAAVEDLKRYLRVDEEELEYLLWDRLLERELTASGKPNIVDKTPINLFMWPRLQKAWPDARFIFLKRHPVSIAKSLYASKKADGDWDEAYKRVQEYVDRYEAARAALPGPTVSYEDLVSRPEQVTQEVCAYLGVPWEPTMLDYGSHDHGPMVVRLGDWSDKIKSGQIDANVELPSADEIPEALREACRVWGYLD